MAGTKKAKPQKICKTAKGKVEFNVHIVVDRNAVVRDCEENGPIHDISAKCFRKYPHDQPYHLEITPLTGIGRLPEPDQRELLRKHVNARALVSLLLSLADAEFEDTLLKLDII